MEIDGAVGTEVIDADGDVVRRHARHRVFIRFVCCFPGEDVNLRVVSHHALVHAVEGHALAIGTPKGSLVDAELITVNALPVDNLTAAIRCQLMLVALTVSNIQLVALHVCRGF